MTAPERPQMSRIKSSSLIAMLLLAPAAWLAFGPEITIAAEPKTAKERLSDKASDEQRVNNCGVPLERRGPTPRPGCPEERELSLPVGGQGTSKANGRQ